MRALPLERPLPCPAGVHKPQRRVSRLLCKASAEAPVENKPEKEKKFLRLQLTPEERSAPAPDIVDQAEESLSDYCSALPEEDSGETERCWEAYNYFEERKEAAEATCSIEEAEGIHSGPGCSDQDRFEDFVRRLFGYASVKNFVGTLSTLARFDKKGDEETERDPSKAEPGEVVGMPEGGRDTLVALFEAMDKDGNGKLDTGEFREAMQQLGGSLSGDSVSTIFDAMGIQGYITLDQFLDIVEVEGEAAHTPLNNWLQRKMRLSLRSDYPSSLL